MGDFSVGTLATLLVVLVMLSAVAQWLRLSALNWLLTSLRSFHFEPTTPASKFPSSTSDTI